MKKIRTFIATLLLLAGSSTAALADNYQYLIVNGSDTESTFTVSNIQKITFDATDMVFHLSDGSQQRLALAGLQKMFFSNTPTGIAAVSQSRSNFQIVGGQLRAAVAAGERITIYNVKGVPVFSSTDADASFDLTTLVKGVYIVKMGDETQKVVNK